VHKVLEQEVVIVGAARTPIGGLDGILRAHKAPQLGGVAIAAAVERSTLAPDRIDEVILGNAVPGGLGQAPAKQAAVAAGLPQTTAGQTVNSVCGSGLVAIVNGVNSLLSGWARVVVAGGMESRTHAPYLLGPVDQRGERLPGTLQGQRFNLAVPDNATVEDYQKLLRQIKKVGLWDSNRLEGLVCPFERGRAMQDYAIAYARHHDMSVSEINDAADQSYARAARAWQEGWFDDEVVPVDDVRQDQLVPEDAQADMRANAETASSAYNAASLGDAAAAVVLTTGAWAKEEGLPALGRIIGMSRYDALPQDFVTAPVHAVRELLDALRQARGDEFAAPIPMLEANEAFALQLIVFQAELAPEQFNVHGGAVALRHPLGVSGARILITLLHAMKRHDLPWGIATICFGSGGAIAVAVERSGDD